MNILLNFLLLYFLFFVVSSQNVNHGHHHFNRLHWTAIAPTTKRKWNMADALASGIYNKTTGGLNDFDRELLGKYYSEADSIIEFGVGESTSIASYINISRYTGVDSDTDYIKYVAQKSPSHFRFHYADIGKTGLWGYPLDKSTNPKYPFYSMAALAADTNAFDFYMVDGRFRLACVYASLLHGSSFGKKDFFVGIHDFRHRFDTSYGKLLEVAEFVDGFDVETMDKTKEGPNLHIFRRKESIDDETLIQLWYNTNKNEARL
jgi:hypothetical protein